jgi:hypothetical protein
MDEFVTRAQHLESAKPYNREDNTVCMEEANLIASYVIGTIFSAVAWVEATVNELYVDAADALETTDPLPSTFDGELAGRWRGWRAPDRSRDNDPSLIKKIQVALDGAHSPNTAPTLVELEDFELLIELRNVLTHGKAEYLRHGAVENTPRKRLGRLQSRLMGKFPDSQTASPTAAYIWSRCLGAGCANWSRATCENLVTAWKAAL